MSVTGTAPGGAAFPNIIPEGILEYLPTIDVTNAVQWLLPSPGWMSVGIFNSGEETVYVVINTTDTAKNVPLEAGGSTSLNMVVRGGITRVGFFCDSGKVSQVKVMSKR